MEFIYSIIVIGIIILIVFFIKSKNISYSKNSVKILIKNFGDKDFTKNSNILNLEEKLEIQPDATLKKTKSIKKIIDDAKHKSDIMYKHNMAINKPYTDLTTFKIVANCVIDYSAKKDICLKNSIQLLFVTFQDSYFQEIFNLTSEETELINTFYDLLEGFALRYKKAIE